MYLNLTSWLWDSLLSAASIFSASSADRFSTFDLSPHIFHQILVFSDKMPISKRLQPQIPLNSADFSPQP